MSRDVEVAMRTGMRTGALLLSTILVGHSIGLDPTPPTWPLSLEPWFVTRD